jgi:hypothetical protein
MLLNFLDHVLEIGSTSIFRWTDYKIKPTMLGPQVEPFSNYDHQDYIGLMTKWLVNNELEKIWKEVVII